MDNSSIRAEESTQPESSQAESIQPDSTQPESSQYESTRAELGSPHTSSRSTTNPARFQSPQEASPSGSRTPQLQLTGQHFYQHMLGDQGDYILYPAEEEQYANHQELQGQTPAQLSPPQQPSPTISSPFSRITPGPPVQSNGHTPPAIQRNGSGSSDTPPPSHPLPTPHSLPPPPSIPTTRQPRFPPVSASIEQRGSSSPWSPLRAGASHNPTADTVFPPDRPYPDQMQEELAQLGIQGTATSANPDDEEDMTTGKRRKKAKQGRKRRGHPSKSPEIDREKRPRRDGGDNGDGVTM